MKQTFSHRKIINILFSQINLKAVSFFCLLIDINIFNQYALNKHSFGLSLPVSNNEITNYIGKIICFWQMIGLLSKKDHATFQTMA